MFSMTVVKHLHKKQMGWSHSYGDTWKKHVQRQHLEMCNYNPRILTLAQLLSQQTSKNKLKLKYSNNQTQKFLKVYFFRDAWFDPPVFPWPLRFLDYHWTICDGAINRLSSQEYCVRWTLHMSKAASTIHWAVWFDKIFKGNCGPAIRYFSVSSAIKKELYPPIKIRNLICNEIRESIDQDVDSEMQKC